MKLPFNNLDPKLSHAILDFDGFVVAEDADIALVYRAKENDLEKAVRLLINMAVDKVYLYGASNHASDYIENGSGIQVIDIFK